MLANMSHLAVCMPRAFGQAGAPGVGGTAVESGFQVVIQRCLCHNAGLSSPGHLGLPWRRRSAQSARSFRANQPARLAVRHAVASGKESQMPKIKTKSGAKKRFKITGTGTVLYAQAGKRHGMIKRTKKQIRQLRGTNTLFKSDGDNIKKYWLPNG
jgi:large subunit ribosomal protein L35